MPSTAQKRKYYREQLVEVKRSSEILQTLDADGKLDGLPFMPEMAAYCGAQIRVHRRADRTCVPEKGFSQMNSAVFLHESRCDGSYHNGCERACLLFWKEEWLTPATGARKVDADAAAQDAAATRTLVQLTTVRGDRFVCQATELASATRGVFSRWDVRPFLLEIFHGELTIGGFITIVARTIVNRVFGRGAKMVLVGTPGKKSRGNLELRAGEWIRVKSVKEIQANLDAKGGNCGLAFRPTMHDAIEKRYQVAFPVRRIIIEETGKMVHLSNTVALKGVTCQGACVANCPRNEYLYWRESWLQRSLEDT